VSVSVHIDHDEILFLRLVPFFVTSAGGDVAASAPTSFLVEDLGDLAFLRDRFVTSDGLLADKCAVEPTE